MRPGIWDVRHPCGCVCRGLTDLEHQRRYHSRTAPQGIGIVGGDGARDYGREMGQR